MPEEYRSFGERTGMHKDDGHIKGFANLAGVTSVGCPLDLNAEEFNQFILPYKGNRKRMISLPLHSLSIWKADQTSYPFFHDWPISPLAKFRYTVQVIPGSHLTY